MLKGNIGIVSVASVIQLCCQEKKSGCLSLHRGKDKIGEIFLKDGEIIAARLNKIKGEEALYKLIRLKAGEFSFEDDVCCPEQEINVSCEYLFLEAARQEDELRYHLQRLKTKLKDNVDNIEEVSSFEEIYNLLSQTGQFLEGEKIESLWCKEEKHFSLFLEKNKTILKLTLPPQVILEEVIAQVKKVI
jgi:hypothetical protein